MEIKVLDLSNNSVCLFTIDEEFIGCIGPCNSYFNLEILRWLGITEEELIEEFSPKKMLLTYCEN